MFRVLKGVEVKIVLGVDAFLFDFLVVCIHFERDNDSVIKQRYVKGFEISKCL